MDNNYSVYCHTFPNGKVDIGITGQPVKQRWANGLGYSKKNQTIRLISQQYYK